METCIQLPTNGLAQIRALRTNADDLLYFTSGQYMTSRSHMVLIGFPLGLGHVLFERRRAREYLEALLGPLEDQLHNQQDRIKARRV
jgi:hypothetical protein